MLMQGGRGCARRMRTLSKCSTLQRSSPTVLTSPRPRPVAPLAPFHALPLALPVKRLKLNLALNGFHSDLHVHVVQAAVSNASGEATLFSPKHDSFAAVSSLTRSNMQYYRRTQGGATTLTRKTPLLRLDEYFGRAERRPTAAAVAAAAAVSNGGATLQKTTELWNSVGVIKVDVQVCCGARECDAGPSRCLPDAWTHLHTVATPSDDARTVAPAPSPAPLLAPLPAPLLAPLRRATSSMCFAGWDRSWAGLPTRSYSWSTRSHCRWAPALSRWRCFNISKPRGMSEAQWRSATNPDPESFSALLTCSPASRLNTPT
jgi:hypothetical protein